MDIPGRRRQSTSAAGTAEVHPGADLPLSHRHNTRSRVRRRPARRPGDLGTPEPPGLAAVVPTLGASRADMPLPATAGMLMPRIVAYGGAARVPRGLASLAGFGGTRVCSTGRPHAPRCPARAPSAWQQLPPAASTVPPHGQCVVGCPLGKPIAGPRYTLLPG
jgi:hypothetical protein